VAGEPGPAPGDDRGRRAIRLVAGVEAAKGLVVLLAATGLLALVHHDLNELAARLVAFTHLNPAAKYPRIFLDAVEQVPQARLAWLAGLAAGAAGYAAVRLVEAWGLWRARPWAEWLAALSGAVYVPFEMAELVHRPGALAAGVLTVNLMVVALMAQALWQRRRPQRGATRDSSGAGR